MKRSYETRLEYKTVRGTVDLNEAVCDGWRFVAVVNGLPMDARFLLEKRFKRAVYSA